MFTYNRHILLRGSPAAVKNLVRSGCGRAVYRLENEARRLLTSRLFGTHVPASLKEDVSSYSFNGSESAYEKVTLDTRLTPRRVVLFGRPNVGKSSLFNALSSSTVSDETNMAQHNRPALVSSIPGTTRDQHVAYAMFGGLSIELVDTGGIVPALFEGQSFPTKKSLLQAVSLKALEAASSADVILFVLDGTLGLCEDDCIAADALREHLDRHRRKNSSQERRRRPRVVVVINKAERRSSVVYNAIQDCYTLKWGDPVVVSAYKSTGFEELHRSLCRQLKSSIPLHDELDTIEQLEEENDSIWTLPHTGSPGLNETITGNLTAEDITSIRRLEAYERYVSLATKDAAEDASEADCWTTALAADARGEADISRATGWTADWTTQLSEQPYEATAAREFDNQCTELSSSDTAQSFDEPSPDDHDRAVQYVREVYGIKDDTDTEPQYALDDSVTPLDPETKALHAFIDSTMRPLPPPQSTRLARWLKHKSGILNVNTIEMSELLSRRTEDQRGAAYTGDTLRLEFETAERFLQLEAENEHINALRRRTSSQTAGSGRRCAYSSGEHELLESPQEALPWTESATETSSDQTENTNFTSNAYEALLPSHPFMGAYFPINASPKSLARNADRRDAVMHLRREAMKADILQIALVGVPNSGKSSLLNALTETESAITSSTAGTTTDGIEVSTFFKDKEVRLLDTAGIGSRWRTELNDLARRINVRVIQAIRSSELVVIMVDATKATPNKTPLGAFARQELDLLGLATKEFGKIAILAINKWDTVPCDERVAVRQHIMDTLERVSEYSYVPVVFLSARNKLNVATLVDRCLECYERWHTRVPTGQLNRWLQTFVANYPPPWHRGSKVDLTYIVQMQIRPPLFVLHTNIYGEFPKGYSIMLKKHLAEEFNMHGVPIRVLLRSTTMAPSPRGKNKRKDKAAQLKLKRRKPTSTYQKTYQHPVNR